MDKRTLLRWLGIGVVGIMPPMAAKADDTPDWKKTADETASLWRIHEENDSNRTKSISIQRAPPEYFGDYAVYHHDFEWMVCCDEPANQIQKTNIYERMEFETLEEATKYALIRRKMFYGY